MTNQHNTCPQCDYSELSLSVEFCPRCTFPLMLLANKYKLEQKLGEGGFADVYLAYHIHLEEYSERVVKVVKPKVINQPGMKERFWREIQITSKLARQCEHIVYIHDDFGDVPHLGSYYVMEYLDGTPLHQYLENPNELPSLAWCIHVFVQLCDAMHQAHSANILHRDIKPDNLFVIQYKDNPCFLKVLDFGIAKVLHGNSLDPHRTQGVVGTPIYAAPEQFLNKEISVQTDVYAMGVLLYQLLTGEIPFWPENDDFDNLHAWLQVHTQEPPPPMDEANPARHITSAMERVVFKALEKNPGNRYVNTLVFKEELLEACSHLDLSSISSSQESYSVTVTVSPLSSQPFSQGQEPSALPKKGSSPSVKPSLRSPVGGQQTMALETPTPESATTPGHPSRASLDTWGDELRRLRTQQQFQRRMLLSLLAFSLIALSGWGLSSVLSQRSRKPRVATSGPPKASSHVQTQAAHPVMGRPLLRRNAQQHYNKHPPQRRVLRVLPRVKPNLKRLQRLNRTLRRRNRRRGAFLRKATKRKVALSQPQIRKAQRPLPRMVPLVVPRCPMAQSGASWVPIATLPHSTRLQIVDNLGMELLKPKSTGHCLWFDSSTIRIRLTATQHRPCSLELRRRRRIVYVTLFPNKPCHVK